MMHTYGKRGTIPGHKIQGQTAKCNSQNQTLSFAFSHCKYFHNQETHEYYFLLQVYNYITYTPESKIRTRHKKRKRQRERETKRESEWKGGREREKKESESEEEGERERRD